MVEAHVAVICAAVAALAVAAAALGIVGEATKSKSFVRYDGKSCVYRRTPAFGCGIAAAASLLTGQIVLTAAAGCWGRCRRTRRSGGDHRRVGAVFSALLSWFLTVLAACAFVVGAVKNQSGERRPKEGVAAYYRCTVLVAGVFAGGSFFSLAAAALGIASYVALESADHNYHSAPPRSPPVWLGELLRQDAVAGQTQGQLGASQGCTVASAATCGSTKDGRAGIVCN